MGGYEKHSSGFGYLSIKVALDVDRLLSLICNTSLQPAGDANASVHQGKWFS